MSPARMTIKCSLETMRETQACRVPNRNKTQSTEDRKVLLITLTHVRLILSITRENIEAKLQQYDMKVTLRWHFDRSVFTCKKSMSDESEPVLNINDLIQFYEDVDELAGAHGTSDCTYPLGYVKRQAIYSCITCWEKSGSFCGICTACYLKCHNTHDALQLYTKRYEKDPVNEKNIYGHNFEGKYCYCNEKSNETMEDDMFTCIFCEDWFHKGHITGSYEDEDDELICKGCAAKRPFLAFYIEKYGVMEKTDEDKNTETETVHVEHGAFEAEKKQNNVIEEGNETESVEQLKAEKVEYVKHADGEVKNVAQLSDEEKCVLPAVKNEEVLDFYNNLSNSCLLSGRTLEAYSYDVFMRNGWRKELCHCLLCLDLYKTYDCEFLLDDEDTFEKYNENSQKNPISSIEEMFDHYTVGMNPSQKLEIAYGIAEMKKELSQMVAECDGQTITMEDVQRLNQRLEHIIENKRARFEDKQY
ncbi:putative E3 ubiquitin-protein ligase UBR7 [Trichinella spiralis]|uniref:Putative E3 ubiquitin-protein ligase UBR7 n=1 Tax=Trichinella spiralis TaxID=6334 RepID=A0A0V1B1J8_TRISP|nr:putative E3 ubiquitin-protein ligase UBR7 [Trichinella spiralis]